MSKVVFEFDPFEMAGVEPPSGRRDRREAMKEIAEFVRDEMLQYFGEGKSPVASGEWKKSLSAAYKQRKSNESGVSYANMELSGDLLDALDYKIGSDGTIVIGWFDAENAAKAEGHQTGYEGHPTIKDGPRRQLLPDENQNFRRNIVQGMRDIASEFIEED